MSFATRNNRRQAGKRQSRFGLRLRIESLEDRSLLNIGPGIESDAHSAEVVALAEVGAAEIGAAAVAPAVEASLDANATVAASDGEITVNGDIVVDPDNPLPIVDLDGSVAVNSMDTTATGDMEVDADADGAVTNDASAIDAALDANAQVAANDGEISVNGDIVVDPNNPLPIVDSDGSVAVNPMDTTATGDMGVGANVAAGDPSVINAALNAKAQLAASNGEVAVNGDIAGDADIINAAVNAGATVSSDGSADDGSSDNLAVGDNIADATAMTHLAIFLAPRAQLGIPATVTLVAQDSQNHLATDYSGTMNLTSSDAGAALPDSVTFQNGRASFQVMFATGGAQTITATDNEDSALTGTATTYVAVADEATHLVAYLSPGVQPGRPTTVRLVARDAENQVAANYDGTVELSSTDAGATFPSQVTFHRGRAAFQATFATAGQQTLTATDSADPSISAVVTTNVAMPAAVTHFSVLVASGAQSGSPSTVRLRALDAQNRLVPNYSGTVNLSSSDAAAILPSNVMFHNGHAMFQATFATPGSQTLTATDSANPSVAAMTTVNVDTSHLALSVPLGVQLGVPTTVRLAALDATGQLRLDYSGTVNLTSSDSGATLPASVTFENGQATIQATFQTEGQQTLTAMDAADASIMGVVSTHVAAQAAPTHFTVSLVPGAEIGSPTTVRILAEDAQNRVVRNFSGTVNVSSTDGDAQLPATVTFHNGRATFDAIFATQGPQTLTVTDTNDSSITGMTSTNVATQAVAAHFAILASPGAQLGMPSTVRIMALDAENQLVRNYAGTVNLSSSDASAVLPTDVTFHNGMATFPVTYGTQGQQSLMIADDIDASIMGTSSVFVASAEG